VRIGKTKIIGLNIEPVARDIQAGVGQAMASSTVFRTQTTAASGRLRRGQLSFGVQF
jgi:hypothetical protein